MPDNTIATWNYSEDLRAAVREDVGEVDGDGREGLRMLALEKVE